MIPAAVASSFLVGGNPLLKAVAGSGLKWIGCRERIHDVPDNDKFDHLRDKVQQRELTVLGTTFTAQLLLEGVLNKFRPLLAKQPPLVQFAVEFGPLAVAYYVAEKASRYVTGFNNSFSQALGGEPESHPKGDDDNRRSIQIKSPFHAGHSSSRYADAFSQPPRRAGFASQPVTFQSQLHNPNPFEQNAAQIRGFY